MSLLSNAPQSTLSKVLYVAVILCCFLPFVTAPMALLAGLLFALLVGQPFPKFNKKASKYLLQAAVVGLGFGMNLHESLASGKDGMMFTILTVSGTMMIGWFIGRKLKLDSKTSYLISAGTAICGGSAIAAVGPVIKANDGQLSVALGIVFILNAIALFLFPVLGNLLNMSQREFGLWSAIAIHDTSSVVGAASTYGQEALSVATTVKLTRALWIIPLAFVSSLIFKQGSGKMYLPWFILLFVVAMVLNTYTPLPDILTDGIVTVSKRLLTVSLFFIGASLSWQVIRSVGLKAIVLGVLVWLVIGVSSLLVILSAR
ncbi:MAG: putative sulfate exporter family transporter [Bacteroidales bacterium]|nr:putative sulfate exporter family transporter [Bacteroidales bacterium]